MAVTSQESTEYTNAYSTTPPVMNDASEWAGRVRIMQFTTTQSGAGDATSSFAIGKLPPGKITLIAYASSAYVNWTTASATMDLGWDAYTDQDGNAVAASVDGIDNGVSVDTAGFFSFGSGLTATGGLKQFSSREGVVLRLSSTDTAIADTDTAVGYLLYVND